MNHPRFIYGDPIYGYYYNLRGDIEPIPPPPPLPYIPPPPPLPYIISISNEHSLHIPIIINLLSLLNAPFGKYDISSRVGAEPVHLGQYVGGRCDPPHYTIIRSTAQELQGYQAMHLYINPVELTTRIGPHGPIISIRRQHL